MGLYKIFLSLLWWLYLRLEFVEPFSLCAGFKNALRQRRALNDFSGNFQMQPLFPWSETLWPFQFAKDGIWMYGGCFPGCETLDGLPDH